MLVANNIHVQTYIASNDSRKVHVAPEECSSDVVALDDDTASRIVLVNSLDVLGGISFTFLGHFSMLGSSAHDSLHSASMSGNQGPSMKHAQDPGTGSMQQPYSSPTSFDATSSQRHSPIICLDLFTPKQGIGSKC